MIRSSAKLTSRCAVDTLVADSPLMVPRAAFDAPAGVYGDRRVEHDVLLVHPAGNLRLINHQTRAARRRAGARPAAVDRSHRRRRRCLRGGLRGRRLSSGACAFDGAIGDAAGPAPCRRQSRVRHLMAGAIVPMVLLPHVVEVLDLRRQLLVRRVDHRRRGVTGPAPGDIGELDRCRRSDRPRASRGTARG